MCDSKRLDEIQGQLDALRVALALKLNDVDFERLSKLYGEEGSGIPHVVRQALESEVQGDREWFLSTLHQMRIVSDSIDDIVL